MQPDHHHPAPTSAADSAAPSGRGPAELIHAAVAQGWPPHAVDLVAALATAGIPHRVEPQRAAGWVQLFLPEQHTPATGIARTRWEAADPPGWRSTWLDPHRCRLAVSRVRLPTTSLMYLQPPPSSPE
ncbi:hypothetical protein DN069_06310 [Streptacidiphilus pinicola]|uniref:Uncharacterized protein n=1 Tax=Streptacidiphilus pinicola TaxID=2219663 RepID=A0A2X0KB85_9ACTN|nr:hypothetical protein DN069_06310 [Streptacidiphilus pinicola]